VWGLVVSNESEGVRLGAWWSATKVRASGLVVSNKGQASGLVSATKGGRQAWWSATNEASGLVVSDKVWALQCITKTLLVTNHKRLQLLSFGL
jgi:hypothetical protein